MVFVGCSDTPTSSLDVAERAPLEAESAGTINPTRGFVRVCKIGPEGTVGHFSITATAGQILVPDPADFTVASGSVDPRSPICRMVWQPTEDMLPSLTAVVKVIELPTPGLFLEDFLVISEAPVTFFSDGAEVILDYTQTAVFGFKNAEAPGGGEGCTPGFWKQRQHFDSWTGYSPDDMFFDVFGVDAFPGMSLLDVLRQGGGGLKALGRHTVAALLDAANPDVAYGMSEAEIIAAFADAFDSRDFEDLKDLLEERNESGCPLS
jgi:hypothetical protein